MDSKLKEKRQQEIEQAAYDLLEQHGYDGISMLKIAERAKASNETLYRWYGDKKGLFRSLVQSNAQEVRNLLLAAGCEGSDMGALDALGPCLLKLLVGERAVALNRAAAADPTGELGKELAKSGRDSIAPLVNNIFAHLCAENEHWKANPSGLADIYLRLLIGDLQIRRTTGAISKFSKAEISKRSLEAKVIVLQIM